MKIQTKKHSDPIPVMESFYTIQGEGNHQGKAAYFVRLGGCDVGCVWCDVKESWEMSAHPLRDIAALIDEIPAGVSPIVVVTGGEPLMHDLNSLTTAIHARGLKAHLETSGSHPLTGDWDWICLSPKKFKSPLEEVIRQSDELKVVIYHSSDFEWGEKFVDRLKPSCLTYLQPEWSRAIQILPSMIEYIKKHPRWIMSLQVHKYIQVP